VVENSRGFFGNRKIEKRISVFREGARRAGLDPPAIRERCAVARACGRIQPHLPRGGCTFSAAMKKHRMASNIRKR
jgi:hypothetical protein